MAYIGKTPTIGNFQKCDAITVVNGQASYTMQVGGTNVSPESENHMLVSLNGILQAPVDSFTVSGSTITFASNLATGDVIDFIMLLGNVLDLGVPSDNTVSTAKIVDGAITKAKTSALMYPAFEARLSSTQSINHNTFTKVQCDTEHFDTDSAYDSSTNYRFTPQVAGKYYCYFNVRGFAGGSDPDGVRLIAVGVYKNGSSVRNYYGFDANLNDMRHMTHYVSTVIDLNGSTDYLEFYGLVNAEDGSNTGVVFNSDHTYFGAYRIGD